MKAPNNNIILANGENLGVEGTCDNRLPFESCVYQLQNLDNEFGNLPDSEGVMGNSHIALR